MTSLKKIKHKWLRNFGYALSLTTIAFIFQACYGPRRDFGKDVLVSGTVTDIQGNPIQGIKISNDSTFQYERTDENGYFYMYVPLMNEYKIQIEDDRDSVYTKIDTIFSEQDLKLGDVNITLQSKQDAQ